MRHIPTTVLLICAVRQEATAIPSNRYPSYAQDKAGEWKLIGVHDNDSVVIVCSGIGRRRVEEAVKWALVKFPVYRLVSFGFAGALTSNLKLGDVMIPGCVTVGNQGIYPLGHLGEAMYTRYGSDFYPDLSDQAASIANRVGITFTQGNLLTMDRLIRSSGEKQSLGAVYQAQAVDMESYWVGRIAQAANLPFLIVRAISDISTDELPPFDQWMNSGGPVRTGTIARHFISHPADLTAVVRLIGGVRRAQRGLRLFFQTVFPQLI